MRKKTIIAAGVLPLVLVGALWARSAKQADAASPYRFATVETGSLEATVSATGALSAVTTVQVGTQVSGQVSALYVDFNDPVTKGQLLARIDPTLAQQAVREAEATLARDRADLQKAQDAYDRTKQLHDGQVVTDSELNDARYALQVAQANLSSGQVAVDRARRNLAYTEIHAPIDGTVVERNVDVGQTVAASLSAPQLFLIAQDLSEMQILASVDESDIGLIHEGQPVHFTVQAYADETFTGTVKQVRLQSTTQENVVSYTAVVSVQNPDGRLLPGMTATVDFVTGEAADTLLVPNAALRFRPTAEMVAAERGTMAGQPASAGAPSQSAALWYLKDGQPAVVRVRTGITDGQRTVVSGTGLTSGMQVIVGTTAGSASSAEAAASPFQQQGQRGFPRPGGF